MKTTIVKNPVWSLCALVVVSLSLYWGVIASDKYVSETNVVLESPQLAAPTLDFSSLLSGSSSGGGDMLLLRDYLLSVDMLRTIDDLVGFREHYASREADFFSALSSEDVPIEELHEYYLKTISVELDEYANVLRIKVEAFSPEIANKIATLLLKEGEKHMNALGKRLAQEQVAFLEQQVDGLSVKYNQARNELLEYQNKNGLVSPTGTVESLAAIVAELEGRLANLQAQRTALRSFQSSRSPEILKIDSEIKALRQQIKSESGRMAQSSGGALNALSSEYQTLELKVVFAQESYSGALAALENTRIEAARKLKQVSVLQSPTFPEYPLQPERLYNIIVSIVITLFIGLIAQMMILIIRDHRD